MTNKISPPKLQKLEAIRGFAAIYVVFYHLFASGISIYNINFSFLFRFGQEAVILFFVLSGFVIYYSFEKTKDKSIKVFFKKRFLRVYIPLIIVFVVNYFLFCYYSDSLISINIKQLMGNLLMTQDLADKKPNVLFEPFLQNSPLWSLSYEWWFYFLFIFIYKNFNNSSILVYSISLIAAITYSYYPNFINRELMYLSIWWFGVDIAKLYLNRETIDFKNLKTPFYFLTSISVVLLINILTKEVIKFPEFLSKISSYPWLELRHFVFTLIVISFSLIWKKLDWIGFKYTFGPFAKIAPISFCIYISHWFLVYNAKYLWFIENKTFRTICYLMICVIFSYLVERVFYPKIYKMIN